MEISDKINHLPILKKGKIGGSIGYFDQRPVEIAELVLAETVSRYAMTATPPQETVPQRRIVVYALGRTKEGKLVTAGSVDDKTGLVPKGEVTSLKSILDYKTITSY